MVTLLECVPIAALLEFVIKTFFTDDGRSKKEKMEFASTLNRAESILTDMEPLINGQKPIPVGKEDLKKLKEKLEKGNKLVLEIRTSDGVDKKRYNKELQDWMQSLKDSLTSALVQVLIGLAADVNQIKRLLLLNHLKGEAYHIAFEKFLRSEGLEELLPGYAGREPVRAHQTEDAKKLTSTAMLQLTVVTEVESASEENHELINPIPASPNKTEETNGLKRTRDEASANNKRLESKLKMPLSTEENTPKKRLKSKSPAKMDSNPPKKPKINLRKVKLAVWVRDEFCKGVIKKLPRHVTGVISAETIEIPNTEKDSVIVKASKDLDVNVLTKHLKRKFGNHRQIIFESDGPWDET